MPFGYFVYRNLLYLVYSVPTLNLLICHLVFCVPKLLVPSIFGANLKTTDMPLGYFVYRNLLYQVYSVPTLNLLICHLVTLCTEICCTKFIFRVKSVKDMNNNNNKKKNNNNKKKKTTIKIDKALMLRIRGKYLELQGRPTHRKVSCSGWNISTSTCSRR